MPPPPGKFTYREEVNVLTLLAFRNGPIEDLHAGTKAAPQDPDVSRITDEEMKTLTIFMSRNLAKWLALRDSDRNAYLKELAKHYPAVSHWER